MVVTDLLQYQIYHSVEDALDGHEDFGLSAVMQSGELITELSAEMHHIHTNVIDEVLVW